MVVLAAGMVAATLRPGADTRLLDLYLYAGADDDLEHIRNYAAHLAADRVEYEQLIDQAHLGAHKLLKTPIHRAAVIRVAEALLEKQTLDNVAVQQIIDEVSQESATTDHWYNGRASVLDSVSYPLLAVLLFPDGVIYLATDDHALMRWKAP
jgi:hypothetical protein